MTRRIDAGPLLALVGAVLLLVGLFLDWYEPGVTAWDVFELVDLLVAALAVTALVAAAGLMGFGDLGLDRRLLFATSLAALVVVAAAIIDPPPAASGADPDSGLWLSLAAALVMTIGAVLTMTSISVSLDIEARDRRRRVSALDARDAEEESPAATSATDTAPGTPYRREPEPTQPLTVDPEEEPGGTSRTVQPPDHGPAGPLGEGPRPPGAGPV
jgi:hypothetical protein